MITVLFCFHYMLAVDFLNVLLMLTVQKMQKMSGFWLHNIVKCSLCYGKVCPPETAFRSIKQYILPKMTYNVLSMMLNPIITNCSEQSPFGLTYSSYICVS